MYRKAFRKITSYSAYGNARVAESRQFSGGNLWMNLSSGSGETKASEFTVMVLYWYRAEENLADVGC